MLAAMRGIVVFIVGVILMFAGLWLVIFILGLLGIHIYWPSWWPRWLPHCIAEIAVERGRPVH
jgi:hypothetical protein